MPKKNKQSYKVGRKQRQKKSRKGVFLVAGTVVLLVVIAAATAWATGYVSKLTNYFQHTKPQQITPANKVVTKPVMLPPQAPSKPTVSIVAPGPQYDYQFPPIQNGLAPLISRIPTKQKVVFLTIDDGIVTNTTDARLMQAEHVNATFFLVHRFINNDWNFFADLAQQTGSDIENHSYDHYVLPGKSYDYQKWDICSNADAFQQWFGKRPVLFRPSGGGYDSTTQKAAADCGMSAVILWDATINNGVIKYQHGSMQPGDIVLMHFRSTFAEDLSAFAKAAQNAGLQPELLSSWASQTH